MPARTNWMGGEMGNSVKGGKHTKLQKNVDITVDKGVARIKLPERTKFDVNWFQAKYRVVAAIRKNSDVTDIEFLEHYEGTKPEKKEPKKAKKSSTKKSSAKPKKKKSEK